MNKQAFNYLQERIRDVMWTPIEGRKDSPKIAALRARLIEHDERVRQEVGERIDVRKAAVQAAKEVLFAGDYAKAVEAVKRLESFEF